MDIDLSGQILGLPIDISGHLSNPPIWNNAILAAALSAILVFIANLYINHRQNRRETRSKQLQIINQLMGRRSEILDILMSLIQTTLNTEFYGLLRTSYKANDTREGKIIDDEYFRLRQFGDSLIVDASKSAARLNESLSAIQYFFPNIRNINQRIRDISNNQNHLKDILHERTIQLKTDYISSLSSIANPNADQLMQVRDTLIPQASSDLFDWIIKNIIAPVDEISSDADFETRNRPFDERILHRRDGTR